MVVEKNVLALCARTPWQPDVSLLQQQQKTVTYLSGPIMSAALMCASLVRTFDNMIIGVVDSDVELLRWMTRKRVTMDKTRRQQCSRRHSSQAWQIR